jgi:hypothetical protein
VRYELTDLGYQSGDILPGFIGVIDAPFSLPRVWPRPLKTGRSDARRQNAERMHCGRAIRRPYIRYFLK